MPLFVEGRISPAKREAFKSPGLADQNLSVSAALASARRVYGQFSAFGSGKMDPDPGRPEALRAIFRLGQAMILVFEPLPFKFGGSDLSEASDRALRGMLRRVSASREESGWLPARTGDAMNPDGLRARASEARGPVCEGLGGLPCQLVGKQGRRDRKGELARSGQSDMYICLK